MFLTLVTLGIYFFWGKVRVRQYLFAQSEFAGDRFAYHGTGKELLVGFLKAIVIFGSASMLLKFAPLLPGGLAVKITAGVVAYLMLLVFVPIAIVGARRYRLSRTSWRGIRFGFQGSLKAFVRLFLGGLVLTFVTFGLYGPIFHARQYGFLVSSSYFGDLKFEFDGNGRELIGSYLIAALLTLPTLGLSLVWFLAKRHRYYWEHTHIGETRFRSDVTGWALVKLWTVNILLLIVSAGVAWPWKTVRVARFYFSHIHIDGPLAFDAARQQPREANATGEAFDALLNVDSGLGVG
jgi:uncharacterized membrane protein YjgN (DUF898 family)